MEDLSPDSLVTIDAEAIRTLNLQALSTWMERPLQTLLDGGAALELRYEWPRQPDDPRELSECPEPRLWALRADARYPWLPLLLERTGGSLAQHVAMLDRGQIIFEGSTEDILDSHSEIVNAFINGKEPPAL